MKPYHIVSAFLAGPLLYYLVEANDNYTPLHVGTILVVGYVIANLGAFFNGEVSPKRVVITVLYLYAIAFLATLSTEYLRYPYSVALIVVIIFAMSFLWERLVNRVEPRMTKT